MTNARSDIYSIGEEGYFHCISRCVRRAFLCGFDNYSAKSYEHRKQWVQNRLAELLNIFAIECLSYAVMSSHLHSLLHTLPKLAAAWSDREVVLRWCKLFPRKREQNGEPIIPTEIEITELLAAPNLVAKYRERLCDISWFQRCLNEHIARRANAEDECTGRFWEGRFKCKRLEDHGAILACSVYIDLNPIRAKCAKTPETSSFTSIYDRIVQHKTGVPPAPNTPVLALHDQHISTDITQERYIEIVDTTGRLIIEGKGHIPQTLLPIFERLKLKPDGWLLSATSQSRLFRRVIGGIDSIKNLAKNRNKKYFHGLSAAKLVFV